MDLARVPEVVIEHQREQLNRRPAIPSEHPLVFIGVDIDATVLLVAERAKERLL